MQLLQLPNVYSIVKNPSIEIYHRIFKDADIITLHGYMKIIPNEICQMYNIYNLHPAPINIYPQLKGKDPVKRILSNRQKYTRCGSVIHKVIGKVDQGTIIMDHHRNIYGKSNEQVQTLIKDISLSLWIQFLEQKIISTYTYVKYEEHIW